MRFLIRGGLPPIELLRPTSLFYTNYVAEGWARVAAQAAALGVDLWRHNVDSGNSVLVRPLPARGRAADVLRGCRAVPPER